MRQKSVSPHRRAEFWSAWSYLRNSNLEPSDYWTNVWTETFRKQILGIFELKRVHLVLSAGSSSAYVFVYYFIDYFDINLSVNRQPLEDVLADWNDAQDDGRVVGPVGVPVEARPSAFDIRTIPSTLLRESTDDSKVVGWSSSSSGRQEVVEAIPCDPLPIRYRRCCCFPRPRSHTSPSFLRWSSHRVSTRRKRLALDRNCKVYVFLSGG